MENKPQPTQPEPKQAPKKSAFGSYLLYCILICAGVLIAKFAFDALTPRFTPHAKPALVTRAPQRAALQPPPAPPQQSPLETMKKTVKRVVEPFELNGIYVSAGDSCALINNKMVQEGEEVDGATVVKISEDEVQLSRDNKTFTLQSRNR
jgi:hypothetical protein